jgi:alpha-1,3-fucosyltransferase
MLALAKGKQKTAAWFVSHCDTFSKRENLVEKLQNFIDVDVYGKCGTLSCPKNSNECDRMLNTTYKFYLSFENTLCIDYITEKLYNTIENLVVPVIFSGADISHFLPPKSFINAEDFETVEDLANYLKFLAQNPKEYIKYFWWTNHYEIKLVEQPLLCDICTKLNEPNFDLKRQSYVNIKEWWYKNACRKPKIEF